MHTCPGWLREAVIYQIYPQSFQDSNGDGIGDLPGIIQRLDYLAGLGINTIWLNPCFESPFGDAGYDVRDYFKVADRYGSNADLVRLFTEAQRRRIRVVLDLVAGHTSIEHPWFTESATAADPAVAGRYIWKRREFDPSAGPRQGDFVENFFWFQPALNYGYATITEPWQDPVDAPGPLANRRFLRQVLDYWMGLGAAGFRVDMAFSLVKQDPGLAETCRLWRELREWWDTRHPDGILIAEWSDPARSIAAGFHLDFMMHFNVDAYRSLFFNETGVLPYPDGKCYFDHQGSGSPWPFMQAYQQQLTVVRGSGYISLPTSNHDFQRLRCGSRSWDGLRPAWVFLMTQAGPPTLFMGDEIGMRYVAETPAKEGSTLAGDFASQGGSHRGERAGSRTPMQWDEGTNAGFSGAPSADLYLPLDPDPDRPTVAAQDGDASSLLNFVRQLLQLRERHPALGSDGGYRFINPPGMDYPLLIHRQGGGQEILVAINPTARDVQALAPLPASATVALLASRAGACPRSDGITVTLNPFGYGIWMLRR